MKSAPSSGDRPNDINFTEFRAATQNFDFPAPDLESIPGLDSLQVLFEPSSLMASQLKFRFSLDKLTNALVYFATAGVRDLTKLKAVKLLYLADRYHVLRYGRPIIGDRYIAMDLGPVPEEAFQLLSRVIEPAEVEDSARRRVLENLDVNRGIVRRYPVLRARKKPDLDAFSESEIEALAATVKEFGSRSARALVDLTHEHQAYQRADADRPPGSSVDLPYEYFFEGAPDDLSRLRELAETEQEDRDFADALDRAGRAALDAKRKTATSQ